MSKQPDTKVEEGLDEQSPLPPREQQGQSSLRRLWNSLTWSRRVTPPKSFPPISSIPKTSSERLALASADNNDPSGGDTTAKTILYLAYGSNLCAETFLGFRGIRPISQINVSAPAFDLSFDLPGIPYNEPCFANTRPRKIPKPSPPQPPIPGKPEFPPPPPSYGSATSKMNTSSFSSPQQRQQPTWSKGVYGVVYEVTPEDYATIIRTEGGGRGYHDVLTPCFELPPALHVPEKPPIPELPKPFLAHTLYAPSLPLPDDDPKKPGKDEEANNIHNGDDRDDGDGGIKDPLKQPWFRRLLLPPHRPGNGTYAQASARYLKLIRDGAREHALPDDYQAYLASLQPYTITRVSQQFGRFLFLVSALPGFLVLIGLSRVLADDVGRVPAWLGVGTNVWMNLLWGVYDVLYKPLFGDGERTMSEDDEDSDDEKVSRKKRRRISIRVTDAAASEKNRLLDDW
ncbi:hypothetical protein F5Y09DRAFT_262493 [Xylaria sp. FL1042]|nr:hypothetical protein F5Y09DRAFT_262493 [Xylaria sp. FL1042]